MTKEIIGPIENMMGINCVHWKFCLPDYRSSAACFTWQREFYIKRVLCRYKRREALRLLFFNIKKKTWKMYILINVEITWDYDSQFAHDVEEFVGNRARLLIMKLLNFDFRFSIQSDFTCGRHTLKPLCNTRYVHKCKCFICRSSDCPTIQRFKNYFIVKAISDNNLYTILKLQIAIYLKWGLKVIKIHFNIVWISIQMCTIFDTQAIQSS